MSPQDPFNLDPAAKEARLQAVRERLEAATPGGRGKLKTALKQSLPKKLWLPALLVLALLWLLFG